jgi:site-specific recombinase
MGRILRYLIVCMLRKIYRTNLARRVLQVRRIFQRGSDPNLSVNEVLLQFTPEMDLSERMESLRRLLSWLGMGGPQQLEVRLRFLLQALAANPELRDQFAQAFDRTVHECSFFLFFTEVGLNVEHGLWGDIAGRILAKVLARGDRHDFIQIIIQGFKNTEIVNALGTISPELVQATAAMLESCLTPPTLALLIRQRREAGFHLATHVAHYGLSSAIQRRVQNSNAISDSPFFAMTAAIREEDVRRPLAVIDDCERELASVYDNLENSGVSVDVVNRLETMAELLTRLRHLLKTSLHTLSEDSSATNFQLVREIAEASLRARAVFGHLGRHFYLLSRKVVERNGRSGEHYIARSGTEMRGLFRSAIGGGFIVVAMTLFKTLFIHTDPAPLFLALGIWIIYTAGFLGMQFSGATLATKIPSFTASKLASFLNRKTIVDVKGLGREVRQVLKSQAVALLGNICGVVPLALLVNYILKITITSSGLMDEHYAHHVLENLHPILSFAVPLGALTGLQLWLSSLCGGWLENWVAYSRIPEAISVHYRLRKILGPEAAQKIAKWTLDQSSGIGTNVSLGFLFGVTPLIGHLLGLNWNGNHVTISTASAVFAASGLQFQISWSEIAVISAGLLLIGVMNFVVSFMMALFVAASSRRMQFWRMLYYLRISFKKGER